MSRYYWVGMAICDVCGHTHPAVVIFDARDEPFPKLECPACHEFQGRPLGSTGGALERFSGDEWPSELPRLLMDRVILWNVLPPYKPLRVCLN